MASGKELTWGDVVEVVEAAPFRRRQLGSVCGFTIVETSAAAETLGFPIGVRLVTVEFSDGTDALVPEGWLKRVDS
jgi:hypothetical protein